MVTRRQTFQNVTRRFFIGNYPLLAYWQRNWSSVPIRHRPSILSPEGELINFAFIFEIMIKNRLC
ncbi:hypothetical protein DOY81_011561, partial [Sarcophaga bullata]